LPARLHFDAVIHEQVRIGNNPGICHFSHTIG
jgi:hypothetical protein